MTRWNRFPARKTLIGLCYRLLGNGDARFRRQAGNNLVPHVFDTLRVEKDFYRNALDNFNKVSSGVIGRQQSEIGARAGLKAVDASGEFMVAIQCIYPPVAPPGAAASERNVSSEIFVQQRSAGWAILS